MHFVYTFVGQNKEQKKMKENKSLINAWLEAARPKTLPASLSPVLLACVLAWRDGVFRLAPALLCLGVALLAQIASNFANDYFDFKKGADTEERLGPERAVAQGWIAPKAMLRATFLTLGLSCLCGCMLLLYAGWELIPVGVAIALCVLAYSAGPFPLAYNGLGDVCVVLFYGIIPVCFTYYVQALSFSLLALLLSLSVGLLSTNILIVNNYRDYVQDKAARKRTTIVLFGRGFGKVVYLLNGLVAVLLAIPLLFSAPTWLLFLFGGFFALFYITWKELFHYEGRELNKTLGHTARNVFLFTVLLCLLLIM